MRGTYSYKRITDQQIAHALGITSDASPVAKLMTVTGYPPDKCALALVHAKRRGLVEAIDGEIAVDLARVRTSGTVRHR